MSGGEVPFVVVVFTCLVCTGIMANFTIVLPLSVYWSGAMLADAGIISSYAIGAIISLTFWVRYDSSSIKLCYLNHAFMVIIGNVLFAFTPSIDQWWYSWLARFVLGLEGGAMYNANLALISLSNPANRVKYLAYYQSFVGLGLVLGPAISATTTALALGFTSHPHSLRTILAAVFMGLWGFFLFIALIFYMPDDASIRETVGHSDSKGIPLDNTSSQSDTDEIVKENNWSYLDKAYVLLLAFLGNFMRIFQRLAWEVSAIVLLAQYFNWGAIAAGYSLAIFGILQTVAQYFYGEARKSLQSGTLKDSVKDLRRFETLEIIAIAALFSKTNASHNWRDFFNITFILASLLFYLASCLTSAPLNDLILFRSTRAGLYEKNVHAHKKTLLAMQYGIFVAFFAAPIAARAVLHIGGLNTTSLAGLLVLGWALQTTTNSITIGRIGSRRPVVIAFIITLFMIWSSFDKSLGGTGPKNLFTYHPVAMTIAFYALMTPGHLVYRDDAAFLTTGDFSLLFSNPTPENDDKGIDKSDRRKAHLIYLSLATFFAVVGYFFIFAAHAQSGESQIGQAETSSRSAHVALGYICLLWLAIQATTGSFKFNALSTGLPPVFTWHGLSGKYLLLFAYITSCLGFWLRMNYSNQGAWNIGIKFALTGGAISLFAYRAFPNSMHPPAGIDQDPIPEDVIDRPSAHGQGDTSTNLA
uniref:Cytochrome b561 domain-containing protein n=1 Tax=Aureoumbra lagunensis TaxID=44058 RepID=A0A6S8BJJ5_9STRA|mmetsp:Transcript_3987/g.6107  ORF Transcript_3987/g.6107 Transcript_3987/m.6107 type:complete len:699 (+) Transcript_3987:81-2177(+)